MRAEAAADHEVEEEIAAAWCDGASGRAAETNGVEGDGIGPFLASMLMAAYVMYGFDSAAELSEETNDRAGRHRGDHPLHVRLGRRRRSDDPRHAAGRPDILAPRAVDAGIAYVLTTLAGPFWGPVVLAIVGISIFSAALAIFASATRVMFRWPATGGCRSRMYFTLGRWGLPVTSWRCCSGRGLPVLQRQRGHRPDLSNVRGGCGVVGRGELPTLD